MVEDSSRPAQSALGALARGRLGVLPRGRRSCPARRDHVSLEKCDEETWTRALQMNKMAGAATLKGLVLRRLAEISNSSCEMTDNR